MRGYRPTGEYELDEEEEGYRPRPKRPAPGKVTRTMRMEGSVIARRSTGDRGGSDGFDLTSVAGLVERTAGSGDALPESLRGSFEESLGIRLADVRVHTDAESAGAAHSIAAKAFTVGQDIYFGAGQYDPESKEGKHLLAHEVAHTAQQSAGGASHVHTKLEVSQAGDAIETEADAAADAMVSGQKASVSAAPVSASRTADPAAMPAQVDPAAAQAGASDSDQDATEQAGKPIKVTVNIIPRSSKAMELDAADYLELYKQVAARAQNNQCAGQCICSVKQDYQVAKGYVTLDVTLETAVPTWKQIATQPKEHQDKFNKWAASVKVHEDTHYKKYADAYNSLKTLMKDCKDDAEAEKKFTEVDEAVEADQVTFDNDKSKQPAPLDIPGGTQKVP